jgi:hypothetical protein
MIKHAATLVIAAALACHADPADDDSPSGDATLGSSSGAAGSSSGSASMSSSETGSSDGSEDDDDPGSDDTVGDDGGAPACEPAPVPCEDEMLLDLSLNAKVSAGAVDNTADGDGWRTEVDARAGGLQGAPTEPWVYIRFGSDGAERVDLDDLEALESDAWHIAAKRYSLRLNSGNGGPSCVLAAALGGTDYAEIDERPGVITQPDRFYDDACNLQDDGMGLGAPGFVMTPWWTYPGCVATTGTPFVIDLPDGRSIKLLIESYYASGQDTCNETGAMGNDAGRFVWRWAPLP